MIDIVRDGSKVVIHFSTDLPHTDESKEVFYRFKSEEGYPWSAELAKRYFESRLRAEMKRIRQSAYEQGWKDAKAKRTKETWFSGSI